MNQKPIVAKGLAVTVSRHEAIVTRITRTGVELILDTGRIMTAEHKYVEEAVRSQK